MQIPGGWLADRFGFKKSLQSPCFYGLCLRFYRNGLVFCFYYYHSLLFGLGEGSYFPSASKGIAGWFPQQERSRAMSFVIVRYDYGRGDTDSGDAADANNKLESIFYIIGAIGLVITVLFVFTKRKAAGEKERLLLFLLSR